MSFSRRDFFRYGVGGLSQLMAACGLRTGVAEGARDRPNVLFIAVDDLNDWVGCLGGHPDAITPNIDALADRGRLFTRAYCTSPLCNPSRVSLLTGLLPSTSGVYRNNQPWRGEVPDAITIPGHFMAHGYDVAGAGKIFHEGAPHFRGHRLPLWLPWPLFRWLLEDAFGPWHRFHFKDPDAWPKHRPVNGWGYFDWGETDAPVEAMSDYKLAQTVIGELQLEREEPFFLACGFFRPHDPWYLPKQYLDLFPPESISMPEVDDRDLDDLPLIGRAWAKWNDLDRLIRQQNLAREIVAYYLANVNFIDSCIGRVLDALSHTPQADRTIVVLWSDHGFHLGEKRKWGKRTLWEEATHVPLIVAAPGMSNPGTRCGASVSNLDVFPTLNELCSLTPLPQLEGASLVPLLEAPEREWGRPALATFLPGNHSVRTERWRYIRYTDGGEELYDHERDPRELENLALAKEFEGVKAQLERLLPRSPHAELSG